MADRLKQLPMKLLEMWKKYNKKQKTMIISVAGVIIIAFIILIIISNRVEYRELTITDNTREASQVADLLKKEGIAYKLGSDRVTVSVDLKRYSDAVLLLASNDMPSTGITLDELLENSLNTTNGDRILKLNLFLQNNLRNYLITMKGVEDARVYYIPVDSSNRLLAEAQETNASVLLTVNDEFEPPTAETIAEVVASAIGNSTTDKIRVADQNGNLLFGGERDLYTSRARSTEEYNELLRNNFINNIYMLLIKRGYDDVEIAPHLDIDNTKVTQLFTEYFPAEGQDQGVYKHSYTYKSENAGSTGGGIPGTSSNDETDYMIEDSSSSEGSVEIEEYDYLPNERVTNTEYETGVINVVNSSVGLVLRKYRTYKEEELERAGLLEEMTFEEYIDANNEDMALEVEEDVYTLVSFASGISRDKIHITAIEKPVFVPKVVKVRTFTDYLQYILAALIIGLIVFVVIKAFRPIEVTELEPELSVEQLLATTKEGQEIEEIDFEEVSEVRRLIEKFVDEKPEAVAQLLRNWLNEDWG